MSQKHLVEAIGVSRKTISLMDNIKRTYMK
ncbi:hypothetical protein [Lacrimispora aerotolerans]